MTIASEITRLQTAKSDIKTAIESKWVSVPSSAKLDTYDDYISSISQWEEVYKWEYIEYIIKTDSSWKIYVPTSWRNHNGARDCPYSWKISVDWWAETTYTWTGSDWWTIAFSWYTVNSHHTVKIRPVTESYWWALAYWWSNVSIRDLLAEILYDSSYMWYAVSDTYTGDYFRSNQYYGCNSIRHDAIEYLPNTVTTIWINFRWYQYYQCNKLSNIWDEYLPNSVTTIGGSFRTRQYYNCVELRYSWKESLPDSVTWIGGGFRQYQYYQCTKLTEIKWWKDLSIWNSTSYRKWQYQWCTESKTVVALGNVWYPSADSSVLDALYVSLVSVPSAYLKAFRNSTNYPRTSISDSIFAPY
jgi:hypothetical protein